MDNIEYDVDEYNVLVETDFTDYTGEYRVIQYSTGYYALQKLIKPDSILNNGFNDEYVTVLVSPLLDKKITGDMGDLDLSLGKDFIEEVFENIKEADRSYNGHYWELRLFLSEEGGENFTEIITKGDGETLLEQVNELCVLEEKQRLYYLEHYDVICVYRIIILVLVIVLFVCGYYIYIV